MNLLQLERLYLYRWRQMHHGQFTKSHIGLMFAVKCICPLRIHRTKCWLRPCPGPDWGTLQRSSGPMASFKEQLRSRTEWRGEEGRTRGGAEGELSRDGGRDWNSALVVRGWTSLIRDNYNDAVSQYMEYVIRHVHWEWCKLGNYIMYTLSPRVSVFPCTWASRRLRWYSIYTMPSICTRGRSTKPSPRAVITETDPCSLKTPLGNTSPVRISVSRLVGPG